MTCHHMSTVSPRLASSASVDSAIKGSMDVALPASDNTPVSSPVSNPIGDAPANGRPASGRPSSGRPVVRLSRSGLHPLVLSDF